VTKKPIQEVIAYELHNNCYLNITSECTLKCAFCPKYNRTWEVQNYDLRLYHEPSVEEIIEAIGDPSRFNEIVFCGLGEPTKRIHTLLEVSRIMKQKGMIVRVNTDGLVNLVEGRDMAPQMAQVVDKLSISLNAQNEAVYVKHTRPKLEGAYAAMLTFSELASKAGIDVTLTAIEGLEGVNIDECKQIAANMGIKFRTRYLDAVG
jgi:TatD DNase family protein